MTVETTVDPSFERTWRFSSRLRRGVIEVAIPSGPWDDEPDKIQWTDRETDLDCLMVRNHLGSWCGYVGVPKGHPIYGKVYGQCFSCDDEACSERGWMRLRVHGGLMFTDVWAPGEPIEGIDHIPEPGREEKPWWLGFDCTHPGDASIMDHVMAPRGYPFSPILGTYKTVDYVKAEVASLAKQLAGFAKGGLTCQGGQSQCTTS